MARAEARTERDRSKNGLQNGSENWLKKLCEPFRGSSFRQVLFRQAPFRGSRFHLVLMVMMGVSWLWGCTATSAVSPQPSVVSPSSAVMSPTPALAQNNSDPFLGQYLPVLAQVQLGEALINLEVTRTPQEQALGLMFRPSLEDDRGMLFEFSPARPVSFWMKNVVISLDMLFVRDGKLIAIAAEVPPCTSIPCPTYGPAEAIDQVIELRGGRAAELNLQPGDPVVVEWLK